MCHYCECSLEALEMCNTTYSSGINGVVALASVMKVLAFSLSVAATLIRA